MCLAERVRKLLQHRRDYDGHLAAAASMRLRLSAFRSDHLLYVSLVHTDT